MDAVTRRLTRIFYGISMVLLACVTFFTTLDVVGRQFDRAITGAYQLSELGLVWVILLAWPLTEATRGHVNMDIVFSRLSAPTQRRIAFVGDCLTLLAFCIIVWQGVALVIRNFRLHEMIPIIEISLYPFQAVIPVAAAVNCLVLIARMREFLRGGATPSEERIADGAS